MPVSPPAIVAAATLLALLLGQSVQPNSSAALETLRRQFLEPPDDSRIMMRWWWFGPAIADDEIARELQAMKDGGIGGVEIQPVYPVALDDAANGLRTVPFLSQPFLDRLRFAASRAHALGLRVDLTLGSGWPYGGPSVSIADAAGKLRVERIKVPANESSVAAPDIGAAESWIAVYVVRPGGVEPIAGTPAIATLSGGRAAVAPSSDERELLAFIASRTGMMVKRPAIGAEGFVLNHYDRDALARYLDAVGRPLLDALPAGSPPTAIFCDSLEVYGSDWTPRLLEEFERRRGYDLRPYLPALAGDATPDADSIRHDWGQTLTELVGDEFLTPLRAWAAARGTKLRAQVYGIPPASVSSNAIVDLPEGEGAQWRELRATRWAASASHVAGTRSRRLRPGRGCTHRHSWRRRSTSKQKPIGIFSRSESAHWPRLAILRTRRRLSGVAVLCRRRCQRSEPVVDRHAGSCAIAPAPQFPECVRGHRSWRWRCSFRCTTRGRGSHLATSI
jgi:hypothetical protein